MYVELFRKSVGNHCRKINRRIRIIGAQGRRIDLLSLPHFVVCVCVCGLDTNPVD